MDGGVWKVWLESGGLLQLAVPATFQARKFLIKLVIGADGQCSFGIACSLAIIKTDDSADTVSNVR